MLYVINDVIQLFHLFNLLLGHTKEYLHISMVKQFAQSQCYWKYPKLGILTYSVWEQKFRMFIKIKSTRCTVKNTRLYLIREQIY